MIGFPSIPRLIDRAALDVLPDTARRVGSGMFGEGKPSQAAVRFARVATVSVGSTVLQTPRMMIAPNQLEGANWNHDLIIGYGFMRNFVVTFDYPARTISFER